VLAAREASGMSTEWTICLLLRSALAGYALAFLALLLRRRRSGLAVFAAAWLVNAALILANWLAAGNPPFGNMYHVLTFLACCFFPLYVLLALRDRLHWTAAYFTFASAVPLLGTLFMDTDALWRRAPALQSPWFIPHVTAYMISYALAAVAFTLAVVAWGRRLLLDRPPANDHDAAVYRILVLAFPLMTFGMLSGALWAEQAWGAYWSWDVKETWSLITWMLYLVTFHCRRSGPHRRFAAPAHILAFLALITTFVLVNLLPKLASALHSYS
jgi:ABC-type transport system involved in cytochrome c biogenesis permease subunit